MLRFLKSGGKNRQLEELLGRLQMNMSNNYKDAAQDNLRELEKTFRKLEEEGGLSEKQKASYGQQLEDYREKMKNFTHKDQKPYWN